MRSLISCFILSFCFFSSGAKVLDSLRKAATLPIADSSKINIYNRISTISSDNDTALSKIYANEAIRLAQKSGFEKGKIKAFYNLAYIHEQNFNYSAGEDFYLKGIALAKKLHLPPLEAYGYQDYALLLKKQNKHKASLQNNEKALAIYEQMNDSAKMLVLYTNIGNNYKNLNLFEKAIEYHLKSLKAAQAKQNYKAINRAYNNIGLVYERNGDNQKALEQYLLSLAPSLKSGDSLSIAVCYGNIGAAYQNLHNDRKAIEYFLLAKKINEKNGFKGSLAINLTNIAGSYNALGAYDKALTVCRQASLLAKETEDDETEGYAMLNEGIAQRGLKKYTIAESNISKALNIAKRIELNPLIMLCEEEFAKLYKATGHFDKALQHLELLNILKDSMYSLERHEQLASLQTQYDTQEKDRKLAENHLSLSNNLVELNRRGKLLNVSLFFILVLVLLTLLIIRNMKLRQQKLKQNALLVHAQSVAQMQDEKLRISRELHDNIGSQLTFINTSLQSMDLQTKDSPLLKETRALTLNTIRELRNTVWLINKQEFTIDEFVIKINEYTKTLQNSAIQFNTDIQGNTNLKLTALTASHLFRIVQESINNTLKHAHAQTIALALMVAENSIMVTITDDGKGFNETKKDHGNGLKNMQSRAYELKGSCHIQSSPGKGTQVTLKLPLA